MKFTAANPHYSCALLLQPPIRRYDKPGRAAESKRPLRRDVIERGGTSKLGLVGRFAPRDLDVLSGDWLRRLRRCLSPFEPGQTPRENAGKGVSPPSVHRCHSFRRS